MEQTMTRWSEGGSHSGLKNQLELTANKRQRNFQVNRIARTALEIFDEILAKTSWIKPIGTVYRKNCCLRKRLSFSSRRILTTFGGWKRRRMPQF
jgi:hypothetical protein